MLAQLLLSTVIFSSATAFCPKGCSCTNSPPTATCDGAGLTSIPILLNPSITSLSLKANLITSVTLDELSSYPKLRHLDLSENRILSIERGAFYRLEYLKTLKLDNNLLASLGVEIFTGLNSLQLLDLSGNGLRRIATSVFSDLQQLQLLNLGENEIIEVSSGAFSGLQELTELHLDQNKLRVLPELLFNPLINLRVLDLSYNSLELLFDSTFAQLGRLEILNLAKNDLTALSETSFLGLTSLRQLRLDYNSFSRVPTESFQVLSELTQLDISGNKIADISTSAFEGLYNLQQLKIQRCPQLRSVGINGFSGLFALEVLSLSENPQLDYIDRFAFESSSKLSQVQLNGNNLVTLDANLLDWKSLSVLDIQQNPWRCDCQLRWVFDSLESSAAEFTENLRCSQPEEFQSRQIVTLSPSELSCGNANGLSPLQLSIIFTGVSLFLLSVLAILIIRFHQRLWAFCCLRTTATAKQFYSRPDIIQSSTMGKGKFNLYYNPHYAVPLEQQSFLTNSSDYSSTVSPKTVQEYLYCSTSSNYELPRNNGTLASVHSFKVLAKHPLPITEL